MLQFPPATPDHHWPPLLTNRRQSLRLRRRFPTSYSLGVEEMRPSVTIDVSSTGIRLELEEPLPLAVPVKVQLSPLAGLEYKVAAEVVWTRPSWTKGCFQSGLRFDREHPRLAVLIQELP